MYEKVHLNVQKGPLECPLINDAASRVCMFKINTKEGPLIVRKEPTH